jgi:Flp pilus assembly protein TadB/Mg-chelatase subunit ChlD
MGSPTRRYLAISLAALVAVIAIASPALATDRIPGQIIDVTYQGTQVGLVIIAPSLPAGTHIDTSKVSATFRSDTDASAATLTATASPVGDKTITTTATPRVMLAVDVSGSMAGRPIDAVKAALAAFLDATPTYVQVGLMTFTDKQKVVVAPTTDRVELRAKIGNLTTGGQTDINAAVRYAVSALGTAGRGRVIMFSDGDVPTSSSSTQLLDDLHTAQVPVDTVAFGANLHGESLLAAVATASGGHVVDSSRTTQLVGALRDVGQAYTTTTLVTITVPADQAGRNGKLTVQLPAEPNLSVVASTSLTLPGTIAASPAPTALGGVVYRYHGLNIRILLGIVLAAIMVTLLLVLDPGGRARKRRTRAVDMYVKAASGPPIAVAAGDATTAPSVVAQGAINLADRLVTARGAQDRLELALDRAGLSLRPSEWVVLQLLTCAVVATLIAVIFDQVLIGPIVGIIVGWLSTRTFLSVRVNRRLGAFDDQLPDVFQLLSGSLSAGFSLQQALEKAATEGQSPVAGELSRALAESRLGIDLATCLDNVARRMKSTDLTWMAMAIRIQREVGGNLAEVLQTSVHTMRERGAVRRHVRALSAEGRLSAYVLLSLPLGLGLFFLLVRTDYVRPLWTTLPGSIMSITGGVLMIMGWLWMRKLIKVEV